MAEATKKLTRKEKIAAGAEKAPKRKKMYAERLKAEKQETAKATLNQYPTSPRKMRLVADLVRGVNVEKAFHILKVTPNLSARPLEKLLRSAIASWEAKNEGQRVNESELYIKEIFVDSARMLKRYRPAPQGRAHRIRKRSNHVTLILDTKEDLN
ncbi:MAG: 50S ribosomal protein L22 [Bacteroidia bacterium]|nr:50S ribosomal protein L22 [Bacteroidia bacterium]